MKTLSAFALALTFGASLFTVNPAEAGWRSRGYSHNYHARPAYRNHYRPYRGYRYNYRPYYGGYGNYGLTPGAALGGVVVGLVALAAANAMMQNQQPYYPYGYAPPAYGYAPYPVQLPGGAIGVDVNGQPICVGGPDRC